MWKWLTTSRKNHKTKKKLTLANLRNALVAYYKYFKSQGKDEAEWRRSQVELNSPECLEQGYCKDCLCPFPAKLYEPDACELGCYPKWQGVNFYKKNKTTNESDKPRSSKN